MSTATIAAKDERIALRVTPQQKQTIEAAARALGRSVTDFAVNVTVENAEEVLADRRIFHVADSQWDSFLAMLDTPVAPNPGLTELYSRPSVFKQR